MKLKKALAAGLSTVVLISSCLSVSAAPTTVKNLTAEEINLILNVEAYKQAYPDLKAAFGDNTNAYVNHYLTNGVYEGRTKGVLFDPLTYAEAYADIRNAFGYDVAAIVNHYVTHGVAENRTMGTAHGYADIAAAESAGLTQYYIPRNIASEYKDIAHNNSSAGNSALTADNNTANVNSMAGDNVVSPLFAAGGNIANTTSTAGGNFGSPVFTPDNNTANTGSTAGNNTANTTSTADSNNSVDKWEYHHSTSIYHDDGETLWRVEYYDENNKLQEWSDVTNADPTTNSYTENIYSYDEANDKAVLERTDTYVNGVLQSSVPGAN